jgi:restriction endonuclease S subunit
MRDGWLETTLGDVAEWWSGGTPKAREPKYYENGTIPWAVIADMNKGIIDSTNSYITKEGLALIGGRLAPVGSVLISMYASVGKSAIANIPLATNQAIAWSIPNQKKIIPFYLYLVSQQLEKEISDLARGATQRNINRQMLREFTFQLPPLPEQKRIVDLISSVDSYIEALQQQLDIAKRSRNAVLHELLTAGGDDWVEHKLIDMFEIYQPQTIAKSLMSEDGEFIVFGANGPIGRYHEFNHEEPEVVVTCRGATCGTINMTPHKTWITGNAMVVSPKTSEVLKEFLYWALVAGVDIQSVVSGSAQPQITREGLAPVKIKIPPVSQQNEIVDLISGFELNISQLEESLNKSKTLRSGLLSDLLSGEHEIPANYDKAMGPA